MPPSNVEEDNEYEESSICKRALNSCLGMKQNNIQEVLEDTGHTPINQIIKILVLGPGDSGKSTILKQMRVIHGKNYSEDERKKYKPIIIQNILDSITHLVDAMELFSLKFENNSNEDDYNSILQTKQQLKLGDITDWNENCSKYGQIIKSIWNDPSIKICYERRNLFYLNDSTEFFINNLSRICVPNYLPQLDDVLRVRQPTTAIQEYKFKISGTYFMFVDVGGQRSERRKWINCFENVTCILFVASLSDYDLSLSRDELKSSNAEANEEKNRMKDGLDLFRILINWKKKNYSKQETRKKNQDDKSVQITETLLFEKVSIILFLNKEDLFEEKIHRSSLKACFPDYVETSSSEKAKEFIARKYIECDKTYLNKEKKRDIYWHYTFALDRKCIETVVASVKDRILKYMLESMRL